MYGTLSVNHLSEDDTKCWQKSKDRAKNLIEHELRNGEERFVFIEEWFVG